MKGREPRTSKEARDAYKKRGDGPAELPLKEQRILDRGQVLMDRAAAARERERRRLEAKKKGKVKKHKDNVAREQLGIGLATQLAGFSHSQKAMKSMMEAFCVRKSVPKAVEPEVDTQPGPDHRTEQGSLVEGDEPVRAGCTPSPKAVLPDGAGLSLLDSFDAFLIPPVDDDDGDGDNINSNAPVLASDSRPEPVKAVPGATDSACSFASPTKPGPRSAKDNRREVSFSEFPFDSSIDFPLEDLDLPTAPSPKQVATPNQKNPDRAIETGALTISELNLQIAAFSSPFFPSPTGPRRDAKTEDGLDNKPGRAGSFNLPSAGPTTQARQACPNIALGHAAGEVADTTPAHLRSPLFPTALAGMKPVDSKRRRGSLIRVLSRSSVHNKSEFCFYENLNTDELCFPSSDLRELDLLPAKPDGPTGGEGRIEMSRNVDIALVVSPTRLVEPGVSPSTEPTCCGFPVSTQALNDLLDSDFDDEDF